MDHTLEQPRAPSWEHGSDPQRDYAFAHVAMLAIGGIYQSLAKDEIAKAREVDDKDAKVDHLLRSTYLCGFVDAVGAYASLCNGDDVKSVLERVDSTLKDELA